MLTSHRQVARIRAALGHRSRLASGKCRLCILLLVTAQALAESSSQLLHVVVADESSRTVALALVDKVRGLLCLRRRITEPAFTSSDSKGALYALITFSNQN